MAPTRTNLIKLLVAFTYLQFFRFQFPLNLTLVVVQRITVEFSQRLGLDLDRVQLQCRVVQRKGDLARVCLVPRGLVLVPQLVSDKSLSTGRGHAPRCPPNGAVQV